MKFIQIVFFVTLILSSCKKDDHRQTGKSDCKQEPTKYINSELSNFKFKKGSYWVFIDSISLAIDTLKVDSVIYSGISPFNYCSNNYHEVYIFQVNQEIKNNTSGNDLFLIEQSFLKLNPTDDLAQGIYESNSPKTDSLFIYDKYYKSIVKTNAIYFSGTLIYFYLNSDFGFLKKEVYNSTNNQLISKKLLKDKFIVR